MSARALSIQSAWRPKQGHSSDEYEDAFAVSGDALPLRAAVADGATESMFSGGWARAVARTYVDLDGTLSEAVRQARRSWSPPPDARWYVSAKAEQGAHAAAIGLRIDRDGWVAEAVGDCCLFVLRDGRPLESWPLTSASEFSHRPELISSLAEPVDPRRTAGSWQSGDTFLLTSDALAAWLLAQDPVPELGDLDALIERARAHGMRNDDVTAVRIAT